MIRRRTTIRPRRSSISPGFWNRGETSPESPRSCRHSFITLSFFLFHAFIHQSWTFNMGLELGEIQAGPSAAHLPGPRRIPGFSDDSGEAFLLQGGSTDESGWREPR
ncbi:hypothetical protein EV1_020258 [Malus domestica]